MGARVVDQYDSGDTSAQRRRGKNSLLDEKFLGDLIDLLLMRAWQVRHCRHARVDRASPHRRRAGADFCALVTGTNEIGMVVGEVGSEERRLPSFRPDPSTPVIAIGAATESHQSQTVPS